MPGRLCAEGQQTEMKGRISEIDPMISSIRIKNSDKEILFSAPEDLLVRQGLKKVHYNDLHEGDLVEIRYWSDNLKPDKVDVLETATAVPTLAQQPTNVASTAK